MAKLEFSTIVGGKLYRPGEEVPTGKDADKARARNLSTKPHKVKRAVAEMKADNEVTA